MKLYSLSAHPNAPCLVLTFKDCTIMFDCAIDMSSLMHFLPLPLVHSERLSKLPVWHLSEGKESPVGNELKDCGGHVFIDSSPEVCIPETGILDLSTVDVILLSSYHSMLALPFITEYTGFHGIVYATEPTVQSGRQLMEELVEYIERVPKLQPATKWKEPNILKTLPSPLRESLHVPSWRKCYNKHDINAAMSKVKLAGYSEKLNLYGALSMVPLSSGYCIGSCNWVIQSDFEKVTYISGSSLLTTHPLPMVTGPMKNSDVLILTGLNQTPTFNPDNMLGEFCSNLAVTIKNGGNVLVPCCPSGVIYDLFECLSAFMDSAGLTQIPLYFISHVADSSLAYSQIFAEWLCPAKQSKVYLPEPPFPHGELVKGGRLKHFPSIHGEFTNQFKTPCVVFTGHPSLRFGDAVHFMELWGKSSMNTVIFTEPSFNYLDALAPFQPLSMKSCYCPIDPTMNFSQANKLIKELKALHVIIPDAYLSPPPLLPHRDDLIVETDPPPTPFKRADVLTLPVRRRQEKIEITSELASTLEPTEMKSGVFVSTITGSTTVKDNKYVLQPLPKAPVVVGKKRKRGEEEIINKHPKHYVYGNLDIEDFVRNLTKHGVTDMKVEDTPGGHIVHLPSEDTIIQVEEGSTHIFCEGNETLRKKLRDVLIMCLPKF
ncbi:LOW QUALITY PROTEIN: integrator complex subunit 9-like [Saccoglossus kowalevskii]|uniref:LOW QUALITY PROTEIN: integrator complex subunit 9-like n=1 Tax=Saccoglossus kowalevskii TaxID=10224 RepID=A0ABM0MJ88_SACKO|nr:PREDICTED: LOW QUALITY PROTEIN: integrator complex subunit 9-like [Saccoglossus kowalevskii]